MSVSQPFDIAAKLVDLREACEPLIQQLVDEGSYRPTTAKDYLSNRANTGQRHMRLLNMMTKHSTLGLDGAPVDLAHLSDLRAVFDHVWLVTGRNPHTTKGLSEEDFSKVAAPILCPTYPNRVAEWFCTVDTAEAGFVDWRLLSQYLIDSSNNVSDALSLQYNNQVKNEASTPQASPKSKRARQKSLLECCASPIDSDEEECESSVTGMMSSCTSLPPGADQLTVTAEPPKYNELCEGRLAHPPGYHVHAVANHSKTYIGSCSDGVIRSFNPNTLRAESIIHHSDGRFPSSMGLGGNNLYVSDRDGVVLMYDVNGECNRNGNIRKAFRIMSQSSVAPLEIPKTVKFDQLKMERPARAISGASVPASVEVSLELIRLKAYSTAYYTGNLINPLGAVDYGNQLLTAVASQADCRDPHFFAGFSRGVVAWYTPELAHTHTITPKAVFWDHTDQITKLHHCTNNYQLQGLVSASVDGTINIVDLEKFETRLTFKSTVGDLASTTGGGWVEGKRSFTTFDISSTFPLLAAAGTMRYVTLWSGQSRRLVASFADHKHSIVDVRFNDAHRQVISLSKDRTIRVWDLRTMGLLQVIADKERKYTDDPLTALSISPNHNIIAWSGTPFVFPAITGTLALLTQGHPTSFIDVSDCDPLAIAVNRNILLGVNPNTGVTAFEYKAHDPIRSVAHDPSWKRLHILTESNQLEVVIVGQPRPTKRIDVSHLRLRCITFRPSCEFCAAGLVAGSTTSIFFFTDKNVLGLLMPMHVVVLDSLSKNTARPIRGVTGITCAKNEQIAVSMATGEIAVLGMGLNVVNVLFVFCGNERLSHVLAMLRFGGGQKGTMRTGALWERVVAATKKEAALGASEFTKFRHDGQVHLHQQCDALVPFGDGLHSVVSYGNGDVGILSTNGSESAFLASFPGAYTTGTGVVVAAGSGYVVVGDDEGCLSVFRCTIPDKGQGKMEKGARKYFSTCSLFLAVVLKFPFGISSAAVSSNGSKVLVGFECGVLAAVSLLSHRLVWATHDLDCTSCKRRDHQFTHNFQDSTMDLHSSLSTAASSLSTPRTSPRGNVVVSSLIPLQRDSTISPPPAAVALANPPSSRGSSSSSGGSGGNSSSSSGSDEDDALKSTSTQRPESALHTNTSNTPPPPPPPAVLSQIPAWKRPTSRQFTLRKSLQGSSRPGTSPESSLAVSQRLKPLATTPPLPPPPARSATPTSGGGGEELLNAWSKRNTPDAGTTASIQAQKGVQQRLGDILPGGGNNRSGSLQSGGGGAKVSLVARKRSVFQGSYYHALPLGGVSVGRPATADVNKSLPRVREAPPSRQQSNNGVDGDDFVSQQHAVSGTRPGTKSGRNPFVRFF